MTNLINIERGLSEAQRRRLLDKEPRWPVDMAYIEATLVAKGLLRRRFWRFRSCAPTPLGLAIRRHLLENGNG